MNIDCKKALILTIEIVVLKKDIMDYSTKYNLFSSVVLPDQPIFIHWIIRESMLIDLRNKERLLSKILNKDKKNDSRQSKYHI